RSGERHAVQLAKTGRQGKGGEARMMRHTGKFFSLVRPGSSGAELSAENPQAALEYEIVREQASSLGRLGRRLEAALAALQAFDASHAHARHSSAREALLAEAGNLLWHFIVQREACGLRDSARAMQDYGVPNDVRARMGVFPKRGP